MAIFGDFQGTKSWAIAASIWSNICYQRRFCCFQFKWCRWRYDWQSINQSIKAIFRAYEGDNSWAIPSRFWPHNCCWMHFCCFPLKWCKCRSNWLSITAIKQSFNQSIHHSISNFSSISMKHILVVMQLCQNWWVYFWLV